MILRDVQTGEEIRKSIRVINDNSEEVTISFIVSGDLKDNVKLDEKTFTLTPGEEKNAFFTIKTNNPGTYETKINVIFAPNEGNSVGLMSTIIVIAEGETTSEDSNEYSETEIENLNEEIEELNDETDGVTFKPSPSATLDSSNLQNYFSLSKLLLITSIVLIIAFIVLFVYYIKNNKKRNKHITKQKKRLTKKSV